MMGAQTTASVETITPQVAGEWLRLRAKNRRINERRCERIADDIRRGAWVLNGEAIVLDANDVLIDGQHRLRAVVLADAPIQSVVVRGVAPIAFVTIDSGKARTNGDVLGIMGEERPTTLAAALRYPWLYEAGLLDNREAVRRLRPTHDEVVAALTNHPRITDCVEVCGTAQDGILKSAVFPGVYCIVAESNQRLADAFFTALIDGAKASIGGPAFMLRRAIARERAVVGHSSREDVLLHLTLTAWNAHATGRPLTRLEPDAGAEIPAIELPRPSFRQREARP